jgi:hypothetical protein
MTTDYSIYKMAVQDAGPLAEEWKLRPHRLVQELAEIAHRLEKERDQIKGFHKDLVMDFMPETECIEGCDTFEHAEDCPVVNAQASVHKLRVRVDRIEKAVRRALIEHDTGCGERMEHAKNCHMRFSCYPPADCTCFIRDIMKAIEEP